MEEKVGLVGIGLVGTALAENLLRAGVQVTGFDVEADRRQALERLGGQGAPNAAAVAQAADVVFLALTDSPTVRFVIEGDDGILAAPERPAFIIDTTTGDPDQTQEVAALLREHGITYLDATISGSSQQVRDGDAVFMVGGDESALAVCTPLFDAIGGTRFHVGPAGAGARAKLASNLVLGLNRLALAEGLVFARELGLDLSRFLELLKATPAYSRQMDTKGAKMTEAEFAPQARLAQHRKDVDLILQCAARLGLRPPVSHLHLELLDAAIEAGDGSLDNSAIIRQILRTATDTSDPT